MQHQQQFYRANQQAAFQSQADRVIDDIEGFKTALRAESDEFRALLEYYAQYHGKIDVYHRPATRAARPNLGTEHESWYFLDQRGNKIWVQNLQMSRDAKRVDGKPITNTGKKDGEVCVVRIPESKKGRTMSADYYHRAAQLAEQHPDAALRLTQSQNRLRIIDGTVPSAPHAGPGNLMYTAPPPTTFEEAEARLRELRAQEHQILAAAHKSRLAASYSQGPLV